ncbi:GFA family protein [Rhodanobacter umsongensis]|uniref:GFA family protein n=1 Tax=Rhodanobacter umsongensis TaxID=633153 RepID=A0ABW0JLD2_9GAMM
MLGAQAGFPADAVAVDGRSAEYVRVGDEDGTARFHFCSECGFAVFYRLDAMPDVVAVPVGAFADPDFPQPRLSVYRKAASLGTSSGRH